MAVSKLKIFLLCTVLVATISLVVMFHYSVTVANYTKIGVRYVGMLKNIHSNTKERIKGLYGGMILNKTASRASSEWNSSMHEDDAVEILRSVELEINKTELWKKDNNPADEVTQLTKTRRNIQGENIPTAASENDQAKEPCPGGSKQGLCCICFMLIVMSTLYLWPTG